MRSLLESALVRHQAGAILATLLDFAIGGMLVRAGLDPALATFLGAAVGACCNFAIARRYVFRGEGRRIGRQALRYSLVAFGSALANALLVHALGALFPFALARPIAAVIVSLAWNYPIHRSFVFGEAPVSERP